MTMAYLGNFFDGAYEQFPDGPDHYRAETMPATLAEIFRAAIAHATCRIAWYGQSARKKAATAKTLRLTSLVLFALGTIAPISVALLLQVTDRYGIKNAQRESWTWFDYFVMLPMAEIGYVLLACAGALIIFDQFFDSSGSWIRFRQSEARLQVLLAEFRFAWAGAMARCGGAFDAAQVAGFVGMAQDFVTKVEILAEAETSAWAQRFSERLSTFDQNPSLKVSLSREQPPTSGPLNGTRKGGAAANGSTPPAGVQTDPDHGDQPKP
jgi:hypothetical protein